MEKRQIYKEKMAAHAQSKPFLQKDYEHRLFNNPQNPKNEKFGHKNFAKMDQFHGSFSRDEVQALNQFHSQLVQPELDIRRQARLAKRDAYR